MIQIVDRPYVGPRPMVAGTRLEVRHIVELVQEFEDSEADAAVYLHIDPAVVADAMAYYREHREQIDAWIREEEDYAERAYAEWEAEQERSQA